jgi:predicted DNA-binding protein
MTLPGKTDTRKAVNIRLSLEADAQLHRLAEEAGIKPATIARELLNELLPTITSVRTRLQITRKPTNGRSPG